MKKFALLIATAFGLFSCNSNSSIAVYNTSDLPMEVKIDTLVIEAFPRELIWVELGKGKHQIILADGKEMEFDFDNDEYLFNVAGGSFLRSVEEYSFNPQATEAMNSMKKTSSDTITYCGIEFAVKNDNYKIYNSVFIPVDWDYWPGQKLPETIEIEAGDPSSLTKLRDSVEFNNEVQISMQQMFEKMLKEQSAEEQK